MYGIYTKVMDIILECQSTEKCRAKASKILDQQDNCCCYSSNQQNAHKSFLLCFTPKQLLLISLKEYYVQYTLLYNYISIPLDAKQIIRLHITLIFPFKEFISEERSFTLEFSSIVKLQEWINSVYCLYIDSKT